MVVLMNEFVGTGQSFDLDLNAELPAAELKTSSSSTEIDETIEADQAPVKEVRPVETEVQDTKKPAESSTSPSVHYTQSSSERRNRGARNRKAWNKDSIYCSSHPSINFSTTSFLSC